MSVRRDGFASSGRIRQLDLLRAAAVLLVLGRHLPWCPEGMLRPVRWAYDTWRFVGWVGVDLFFVLSGFLVGGLLMAEYRRRGALDVKRFLIRRALKIYPAFYLLLALTAAVVLLRDPSADNLRRTVAEAVYLQNYLPGLWPHTWSLAVEEHFYLLLAAGLSLMVARRAGGRDPFRGLLVVVPLLGLLILMVRVANVNALPLQSRTHRFATHLRVDSLLWGVLLAYLYHYRRERLASWIRPRRWFLVILAVELLAPVAFCDVFSSRFMLSLGLTCNALGFWLVIALSLFWHGDHPTRTGRRPDGPVMRCLLEIGVDSYSIYLWHVPVFMLLAPPVLALLTAGQTSPVLVTAGYLATAAGVMSAGILVGVTASRLIERPVLALRNRLYPSRSGSPA